MSFFEIIAFSAGVLLFITMMLVTRSGGKSRSGTWVYPAVLSIAFLCWSLWAIVSEGLTGFWPVHTQSIWGTQVWFDLLIAVGIGWYLIMPRARTVKMNVYAWAVLILSTGCIGFLAMLSRLIFLEENHQTT